jgi:hypothetical protein
MAGRKPKGYELEKKIQTYLETYELDDLNRANDFASLRILAQEEIILENLQNELASLKRVAGDTKTVKDLSTAIRDHGNTYSNLQKTLGIDRSKRESEGEESVLSYIDKLKDQAKKVWASRLKRLVCKDCNLPLAKYYIYITEKGEEGAIAYDSASIDEIKYTIRVECPRCHKMVEFSNEREDGS